MNDKPRQRGEGAREGGREREREKKRGSEGEEEREREREKKKDTTNGGRERGRERVQERGAAQKQMADSRQVARKAKACKPSCRDLHLRALADAQERPRASSSCSPAGDLATSAKRKIMRSVCAGWSALRPQHANTNARTPRLQKSLRRRPSLGV